MKNIQMLGFPLWNIGFSIFVDFGKDGAPKEVVCESRDQIISRARGMQHPPTRDSFYEMVRKAFGEKAKIEIKALRKQ